MHYQSIPAGTDVEYQGVVYRVRAAYGRVLELESSDCSFARVVHVSSVKRLPPAHENLGCGLAAPAEVGQGAGTCLHWSIRVVLFVNAFLLSVYIVSRAFQ